MTAYAQFVHDRRCTDRFVWFVGGLAPIGVSFYRPRTLLASAMIGCLEGWNPRPMR